MREHYYTRRKLATAIHPYGGGRTLKYQIERDEMDHAACDGLKRIYERDGPEIFKERSGPGCLNRFSASLSEASAGIMLPCGLAAR